MLQGTQAAPVRGLQQAASRAATSTALLPLSPKRNQIKTLLLPVEAIGQVPS
jgi:hypothetical protein